MIYFLFFQGQHIFDAFRIQFIFNGINFIALLFVERVQDRISVKEHILSGIKHKRHVSNSLLANMPENSRLARFQDFKILLWSHKIAQEPNFKILEIARTV